MGSIKIFLKNLGSLFYLMNPSDHTFEKMEDVPDYYAELVPVVLILIGVEQLIQFYRKGSIFRFNDSFTNIMQGAIFSIAKLPHRGLQLFMYSWIHNHCRLITLPKDSLWTWFFCLVGSDFLFYWGHRVVHQNNLLWAVHESHHSSDEYNLTVSLRLNIWSLLLSSVFYAPMLLAVPPPIVVVHSQMNFIYQLWLHIESPPTISLPGLDKIMATPTHHRVHHGRNRRCIDKNFGGVFIIWDRLFGTFEDGKNTDEIVFGSVDRLATFNSFIIQNRHFGVLWKKFFELEGIGNKLSVIFKGPGWSPGKPWNGNIEDIPEGSKTDWKYDPHLPLNIRVYSVVHVITSLVGTLMYASYFKHISLYVTAFLATFTVCNAITLGAIFDQSSRILMMEATRCLFYFIMDVCISSEVTNLFPNASILFWINRLMFTGIICFWILSMINEMRYFKKKLS